MKIHTVFGNQRKMLILLDFGTFFDIMIAMFFHKKGGGYYEDDISTEKETEI